MSGYHNNIAPIEAPIEANRQSVKRHFGVHPYFTRRPPNVVRKYILHYSKENDTVLDPFGGSGVTAVEAFLENRIGIQNDINPLANFIAQGIASLAKGKLSDYQTALVSLEQNCRERIAEVFSASESRLRDLENSVNLPEDVQLPSNSDVPRYRDLFSPQQLISLAILKDEIDQIKNQYTRGGMLLAWSASLAKLNKTFLSAEGRAKSRGGSSIFSIYRYKVAKEPVELPVWMIFYERALNILEAKKEIEHAIELKKMSHRGWQGKFEIYAQDVEELSCHLKNSVDYIFTDPPYGGNISYLDLSVLWNSWLGITPGLEARKKELIVGGELRLSDEVYIRRLGDCIRACVRMLGKKRWLSVVFQHWNIAYFKAILAACSEEGAQLRAAIPQVGYPIWSMHKKKNKQSVLAGELILTFYNSGKSSKPITSRTFNVSKSVKNFLSSYKSDKLYGEYLFNRLVIEAWNNSAIDSLNITPDELINHLEKLGWRYDERNHYWVKEQSADFALFR